MSALLECPAVANQFFAITFTCTNSNYTSLYNHRLMIIFLDWGLSIYDATAGKAIWNINKDS